MKETQKRPMIFEIKPHTRIILMSGLLIMLFVTISMMAVMTLQKVAHSHHIIKQKVMDGQSSSEELSKLFQETEAVNMQSQKALIMMTCVGILLAVIITLFMTKVAAGEAKVVKKQIDGIGPVSKQELLVLRQKLDNILEMM